MKQPNATERSAVPPVPLPTESNAAATAIRSRQRSPNYPFISLERAIEQAKAIYGRDRLRTVPLRVACERWEFKIGGSQSDQTVAALKAFGLVDTTGVGDNRILSISERAYRIIEGATDAAERIKDAALAPSLHGEMWQKFGANGCLPDGDIMRHYLQFDREGGRFNKDSAETFIARFRETIAFAKLESSDKVRAENPDGPPAPEGIVVGDVIQWESQGALVFPEPRVVTEKSPDGEWLFVAESPTGIPASQARLVERPKPMVPDLTNPVLPPKPASNLQPPPVNPNYRPPGPIAGMKQYVLTVDTGEVVARWPEKMSQEDYESAEAWLESMKKKMKRSVEGDTSQN